MKDLNSIIKKLVEEVIDEMTSTASVAGYSTPFAFRKREKNKATRYAEKLGFKVCSDVESNNDGDPLEESEVLLEDVNYDSSKDVNDFRKSLSAAEVSISQKFSAALKQKLLGKNIEIQGSKGYGQFKTKYALRVVDVSVEDWYGKDDYQLIITGEDKKQYFVDVTVPIKIVDSTKTEKSPAPAAPKAPESQAVPAAPKTQPSTELDKAIVK